MIGSHILGETLTGERYKIFLETQLSDPLENVSLVVRSLTIFMQDGTPAHIYWPSIMFLKQMFPGRLLATNGDTKWHARSQDLTPMDLFSFLEENQCFGSRHPSG